MNSSESTFRSIYMDLASKGKLVYPRGQRVIEIENYSYVLPPFVRFQSFENRRMNLDYIKAEMLWYIKGDARDLSIVSKAKIWQDIVNQDGTINSNYGSYIFGGKQQFDNVVKTLVEDRDSRRASMMILNDAHLVSDTKDVPCTYALNFRVRDDHLNMSVHMRSQDAIYGMTNDAPAFSFMHEMMLNALRRKYPDLQCGNYHHICDSFHAYERHFKMLSTLSGYDPLTNEPILDWTPDRYLNVDCPRISSPDEVDFLRKLDFSNIPEHYAFTRWLSGK